MSIKIKIIQPTDIPGWDAYVQSHQQASLYHLSSWKDIIEKTYGHKTYYLMAIKDMQKSTNPTNLIKPSNSSNSINHDILAMSHETNGKSVVGILPLVHLSHFLFGNSLISIPFFDMGGILADDVQVEKILLSEAAQLAQKLKVNNIELRHIDPILCLVQSTAPVDHLEPSSPFRQGRIEISQFHQETEKTKRSTKSCKSCQTRERFLTIVTKSHKVRMLLELPESSAVLMKSFKSKLRSQIKKPLKEGLKNKIGGLELLDDFYHVFLKNMRDLGSPVHSKKLIRNVIESFPENAKIVVIYQDNQPLACSVIVGFKDTLENPWASALRQYSRLSPSMLLYWSMLEYASDNGFKYFDFGRSSPDEGTYKFKQQWGASPSPLYWYYISLNGQPINKDTSEKSKFEKAINYWKKLPVPVTRIIGPMIRKYIGL